ncbi:hypothetical protein ACH5RR_039047 [Cinchona calisaya]|uniref:Uncharacterized protein n=1 Tax=Cinchona calisaya TaxID=153742 RepID=A0ABD2Y2L5_9GENT
MDEEFNEDLLLLIHQFLAEFHTEEYMETLHKLEMASGIFFDIKYFEECVIKGDWEEGGEILIRVHTIGGESLFQENFLENQKAYIATLIYEKFGYSLLPSRFDAVHELWTWKPDRSSSLVKTSLAVLPHDCHEEVVPCLALSENEECVVSASGEKIYLFQVQLMDDFKLIKPFMSPPPAATCLAFYPLDNNLIAIGMEDSVIRIYDTRSDQVKWDCKGHEKRVTGIVFSTILNICVWSIDSLQQLANKFLEIPPGCAPNPLAYTRLQSHPKHSDILVVHETQIAVYKASTLDRIRQAPEESSIGITDAKYSCDGQLIYASFIDGSICVFTDAV